MAVNEISALIELYVDNVQTMQKLAFLGLVKGNPIHAFRALQKRKNSLRHVHQINHKWDGLNRDGLDELLQHELGLVDHQRKLFTNVSPALQKEHAKEVVYASVARVLFNAMPDKYKDYAQPMLDKQLGSLIAVQQEIADNRYKTGYFATPYESLIQEYNPHLTEEKTNHYIQVVRDLADDVLERRAGQTTPALSAPNFDETLSDKQKMTVMQDMRDWFGLPKDYVRIYQASAPAAIGCAQAGLLAHDFSGSNMAIFLQDGMHEYGHILYKYNLPKKLRNRVSGQILGTGHDEAQAYFLENHVLEELATQQFICDYLVKKHGLSADKWNEGNLYQHDRHYNFQMKRLESCDLSNLIHIGVLTDVEKNLINSGADGARYGTMWRQAIAPYQDQSVGRYEYALNIYPFAGLFGNYPSYFEGAFGAAQLYEAGAAQNPQWKDEWRRGEFRNTIGWLAEHAQKPAATKPIDTLYKEATGDVINPQAFLTYYRGKYGVSS
jgi:carboxypeptidase Taq